MLYFSIHRYEFGKFWPNLRESDYDFIGEGKGLGFNINVPLNKVRASLGCLFNKFYPYQNRLSTPNMIIEIQFDHLESFVVMTLKVHTCNILCACITGSCLIMKIYNSYIFL